MDMNEMQLGNDRQRAIQLLARLGEAHGVAGYEDEVRRIFRDELGEGCLTDRMGSTFIKKMGTAAVPRVMVAAHMDEVGFVVQAITRSGMIKCLPLGGWWPHTVLAQRVRIITGEGEKILGVFGAKPPHLLTEAERDKVMKLEDMFIDVGAIDGEDARTRFGIKVGDPIVPESSFAPMRNPDLFMCKAFDNRSGMAMVVQAVQSLETLSHPNTIYGVGTVQEEVGVRGAQTAAFSINPDAAIVLEGAPADDVPGTAEEERQGAVGGGVQIRLMDPSAIMNRRFVQYAVKMAESKGIPHQVAVRKSGSTDARAIHLHGAGVPTIVLGVPARYIHSHNSIINIEDYLSGLRLTLELAQVLDHSTVAGFTAF